MAEQADSHGSAVISLDSSSQWLLTISSSTEREEEKGVGRRGEKMRKKRRKKQETSRKEKCKTDKTERGGTEKIRKDEKANGDSELLHNSLLQGLQASRNCSLWVYFKSKLSSTLP